MRTLSVWLGTIWLSVAQAVDLRLLTESTQVIEGRSMEVQVVARDLDLGEEPELRSGEGLGLSYRGRSGSSRNYNGRGRSEWIFSYTLSGLRPGVWEVGPIDLTVSGRPYHADAVSIEVLPRPESDHSYARVMSEISTPRPYLGEVVLYSLDLLARNGAQTVKLLSLDFGGLVEEPSSEASQEGVQALVDGMTFQGTRVLFPLRAVARGSHQISPAHIQMLIPSEPIRGHRSRGAAESVHWASDAIDVEVRPLPTTGRPDAYSGRVGEFTLEVDSSRRTLELGESLSIKVKLTGNGILEGFTLPEAPTDSPYRVYDEPTETQAQLTNGRYQAQASIQRVLVPEVEGPLTIPPIEISVFNPVTERYEWLRSDPIELEVLPGQGGSTVTSYGDKPTALEDVDKLGEDILPATASGWIWAHNLGSVLPWAAALPALPLFGLIGLRIRARLQARRERPHRRRLARLSRLPSNPEERLNRLATLVHERMAEELGQKPGAIDAEAAQRLGPEARRLYDDLVRTRYGSQSSDDLDDRAKAYVRGKKQ